MRSSNPAGRRPVGSGSNQGRRVVSLAVLAEHARHLLSEGCVFCELCLERVECLFAHESVLLRFEVPKKYFRDRSALSTVLAPPHGAAQNGGRHVPASAGAQSVVGVTNETQGAQYEGIGVTTNVGR
jgi:hypothetical protein